MYLQPSIKSIKYEDPLSTSGAEYALVWRKNGNIRLAIYDADNVRLCLYTESDTEDLTINSDMVIF